MKIGYVLMLISSMITGAANAGDSLANTGINQIDGEGISMHGEMGGQNAGDFTSYAARFELTDNAQVSGVFAYIAAFSEDPQELAVRITADDGNGLPDTGSLMHEATLFLQGLCCFAWRNLITQDLPLPAGHYWVSMVVSTPPTFSFLLSNPPVPLSKYAVATQDSAGWQILQDGTTFSFQVDGTYDSPIGDFDNDGFSDAQDNCINVHNSDQTDHDSDGIGTRCDADFDNDCVVSFLDYAQLVGAFLSPDGDSIYDLSGSGQINFIDIGIFSNLFQLPVGPSGVSNICANE